MYERFDSYDGHGSGLLMRNSSRALPEIPSNLPRCTISGPVYRVDGSVVRNGTITFDSRVPQIIASTTVQPLIVSTVTDAAGQLQAIALLQGLFVQIVVSDNGVTYPPMSAIVPTRTAADFNQTTQGLLSYPVPGPAGPPGAAATIQVGTTLTGASGTKAYVTNVGSTANAVFDFVIPGGGIGHPGPPGPAGSPGTPGQNGIAGQDGLTPFIGPNSNWWIGTTDTGTPASGGGIGEAPTTGAPDGYLRDGATGTWKLITLLDGGLY